MVTERERELRRARQAKFRLTHANSPEWRAKQAEKHELQRRRQGMAPRKQGRNVARKRLKERVKWREEHPYEFGKNLSITALMRGNGNDRRMGMNGDKASGALNWALLEHRLRHA